MEGSFRWLLNITVSARTLAIRGAEHEHSGLTLKCEIIWALWDTWTLYQTFLDYHNAIRLGPRIKGGGQSNV